MTYFDDEVSLKDESITNGERSRILAERTRDFGAALFVNGAAPREVSYILAYIAAEFGLYLTKNSFRVFPVILSAVQAAGDNAIDYESGGEPDSNEPVPDNVISLRDEKLTR